MKEVFMRAIIGFLVLALSGTAMAQQSAPEQIGKWRDWAAYEATENGKKICWMVTKPKVSEPKNVSRSEIYMMVANRPGEQIANELNVIIGYPFKDGSEASIGIDNKQFVMITRDDAAWLRQPAETDAMIKEMRAGKDAIVKGTSKRGTNTTDTFSLLGFTAANKAIAQACK